MTTYVKQLTKLTNTPNSDARFFWSPLGNKVSLSLSTVTVLSGGLLTGCSTPGLKAYLDYNESKFSSCVVVSPSSVTPQGDDQSPSSKEDEQLDLPFCCENSP